MRDEVKQTIDELREMAINQTQDFDLKQEYKIHMKLAHFPVNQMSIDEIRYVHEFIWDFADKYGRKPLVPYVSHCILCEYNGLLRPCSKCLGDWPVNNENKKLCFGRGEGGLYTKWVTAVRTGEKEKAHEYAIMIRDIPFKNN